MINIINGAYVSVGGDPVANLILEASSYEQRLDCLYQALSFVYYRGSAGRRLVGLPCKGSLASCVIAGATWSVGW